MEDLEPQLEEFGNAIHGLSTDISRPKTAFELLNRGQYEDAWQSYLRYFLDPDQPHRFEDDFLSRFLELLGENEMISFSPPKTGLQPGKGVEVTAERQSSDDNRPDLIITSGLEWFLCIELKVHASEGGGEQPQTARYANDENIVPNGVSDYEGGDFIYIKPSESAPSSSSTFSDLDWQEVRSVVQDTLAHSTGHVPARSIAQLSDFSTLIDSQLNMNEVDKETRQRKDLYFQYRDEITEAQDAVKRFVKDGLQQKWEQALAESYQPSNAKEMDWQYGRISTKYGQIRTPRWESARSGSEKLNIHWEHRLSEDDFSKGQLRFTLELEDPDENPVTGSSGKRYLQFRNDILDRVEDSILSVEDPRWRESDVDPRGRKKILVRFMYEFVRV